MNALPDSDQQMRDALNEPLENIHPGRLALCFGGTIGSGLAADLKSSERLNERLNQVIKAHYNLPDSFAEPDAVTSPDPEIAALPTASLQEVALRAGVIYWSKPFAAAILTADVTALHAEIGEELYRYALKNKAWSGPDQKLPQHGTLTRHVTGAGLMCLSAWCERTDPAIAVCVRLKMPPDPVFDAPVSEDYLEIGPKIIRHIASL